MDLPPYSVVYLTDPWKEYEYTPICEDMTMCICFQESILQSGIHVAYPTMHYEASNDMIGVFEVLAYKGYWVYIYRIMMLLGTTTDCLRVIMHNVCNAADRALEWSCSLDKQNEYTDGCIICDGYTYRICNDGYCWECIQYKTHDCEDWHYKANSTKKRRIMKKDHLIPNWDNQYSSRCIVCDNLPSTLYDTCYACNGILCTDCFQEKSCTCQSFYDGTSYDETELVMKALTLCGICTFCIHGYDECVCYQNMVFNDLIDVVDITYPIGQ
jgi:hypothetical protein